MPQKAEEKWMQNVKRRLNWAESKWGGQVSQHVASYFPTQCYSKPCVPWTKNSNCFGQRLVLFWLTPQSCEAWSLSCRFIVLQNGDDSLFRNEKANPVRAFSCLISQVQSSSVVGWELHMEWKEMTGGHGKQQQEGFSKDDNRSEVTKLNHLTDSYLHTLSCCKAEAQNHLDNVFGVDILHQNQSFLQQNITVWAEKTLNRSLIISNEGLLKHLTLNHKHIMLILNFTLAILQIKQLICRAILCRFCLKVVCHQSTTFFKLHSRTGDGDNLIEKLVSCGVWIVSLSAGLWLMSQVKWEMTGLTALVCLLHRQTDTCMSSSSCFLVGYNTSLCPLLQMTTGNNAKFHDWMVLKMRPMSWKTTLAFITK